MNGCFNADLLRQARLLRELSQVELSSASGVSQGNISKLENGLAEPTPDVVEKLSQALRFPSSFFFELDRVYGLPISVHAPAYRKRASVGERALGKLEAELNIRGLHFRRLLKSAEIAPELPLPRLDIDDYEGDVERIADLVRRSWFVPGGPIKNLTQLVELSGCLVISIDLQGIAVDGVTIRHPGLPPCIFINASLPGDRQRFTLAHELGHVVMHQLPSPNMEDEANAFASALLLPARDIRPYLAGGLSVQKLAALKPGWRVSMGALLYRAGTLGAITPSQSLYLWKTLSRLGYKTREPPELDIPVEKPSVLAEIIRYHMEDLGYDLSELSRTLHASEEDISAWHPLPGTKRSHLRVVQ